VKGTGVVESAFIAIIDDNEAQRASLVRLLGSQGYKARSFPSAEAFLAWDGADRCDCIITDVHMPGMSGIDLMRVLLEHRRAVPVVMITGRTNPAVEADALSSGAICLLHKPFRAEELMEYVRKALLR
jgi:FixJ family two-component response regulator